MSFDSEIWLYDNDTTASTRTNTRTFEGKDHQERAWRWLESQNCWVTKIRDRRLDTNPNIIREAAA